MYIYSFYVKGVEDPIEFYTDEVCCIPEEVEKFCHEHDDIVDSFCDHFPMTVKEYMKY